MWATAGDIAKGTAQAEEPQQAGGAGGDWELGESAAAAFTASYRLAYTHAELVLLRAVCGDGGEGDPAQRRAVLDACDAAVRRMHRAGFPAAPLRDELGVCCVVPHSPQGRIEAQAGKVLLDLLARLRPQLSRASPPPLPVLSDAVALYARAALAKEDWAEIGGEVWHPASRLLQGHGGKFDAARLTLTCSTDPSGAAVVTVQMVPRVVRVVPVPRPIVPLPESMQQRYGRGDFVLFADEGAALSEGIWQAAAEEHDNNVQVLPTLAKAQVIGIGKNAPVFDLKREDVLSSSAAAYVQQSAAAGRYVDRLFRKRFSLTLPPQEGYAYVRYPIDWDAEPQHHEDTTGLVIPHSLLCKCVLELGHMSRTRSPQIAEHMRRALRSACCVSASGEPEPMLAPWTQPAAATPSRPTHFGELGARVSDLDRPGKRRCQRDPAPLPHP
eukprot:TRINITY_DN5835_c0_g1_i5.p1 TRINITY_DN5835_c0_g1~~TRINITY_DN5835_c0_g1_i5.p1  ORF type:complete len:441 (+),score=139.32 TRINITY_DN5835_c0_g1_i5:99-1421(+)